MTTPKLFTFVPPYLIQFPTRSKTDAMIMAGRGPPWCRIKIVKGETTTNENKKLELSQFMALVDTL
jgi:hypothetical protein